MQIVGLAGAWEALFAYDSLIFSLTVYKTWKFRRDHAITGVEIPLISLILRDGKIHFEFSQLILNLFSYHRRHILLVRAFLSLSMSFM